MFIARLSKRKHILLQEVLQLANEIALVIEHLPLTLCQPLHLDTEYKGCNANLIASINCTANAVAGLCLQITVCLPTQ